MNSRYGCPEEIVYGKIHEHEKVCGFELIMCLNIGCEKWVQRQEMPQHRNECAYGIEICEFCIKEVIRVHLPEHLRQDC